MQCACKCILSMMMVMMMHLFEGVEAAATVLTQRLQPGLRLVPGDRHETDAFDRPSGSNCTEKKTLSYTRTHNL